MHERIWERIQVGVAKDLVQPLECGQQQTNIDARPVAGIHIYDTNTQRVGPSRNPALADFSQILLHKTAHFAGLAIETPPLGHRDTVLRSPIGKHNNLAHIGVSRTR